MAMHRTSPWYYEEVQMFLKYLKLMFQNSEGMRLHGFTVLTGREKVALTRPWHFWKQYQRMMCFVTLFLFISHYYQVSRCFTITTHPHQDGKLTGKLLRPCRTEFVQKKKKKGKASCAETEQWRKFKCLTQNITGNKLHTSMIFGENNHNLVFSLFFLFTNKHLMQKWQR